MFMMRRALLILIPVLALILGAAYYFTGHRTPANQPALADLSEQSLDTLQAQFNGASDQVRLILLLSPT